MNRSYRKPTPIRGQGENSTQDQPPYHCRQLSIPIEVIHLIGTPVVRNQGPKKKKRPPGEERPERDEVFTPTHALLLGFIDMMVDWRGEGCWASNAYLGEKIGRGADRVNHLIHDCKQLGLIVVKGIKRIRIGDRYVTRRILETSWSRATRLDGGQLGNRQPEVPGCRLPSIRKTKKRREEEKNTNVFFSVAGSTGDGVGDDPAAGGRSNTVSRDRAESPQATTPVSCGLRPPRRGSSRPGQSQNNTTPVAVAVVPTHPQPNNHREGVLGAAPPCPKKRSSAPALKHDSDKSNDSESETDLKLDKVFNPTEEPSVNELIPPTVPQTPTRGRTVEPRHVDRATQLRNAVVTVTKYGKRYTRSSWAKEFAILESTLEGDYFRLTAALDWFCANIQWEFAPQIRSAHKFRERFADVESAMARHARNATKRPTIAQDAQTPEVRGIVRELSSRVWRNGSEEQLPAVVHQSLMNLRSFFKRLRENTPPGSERVVRTLEDGVGNSAHYITGWVRHQGDRLHKWDKWDGSLGRCVWHPGHEDFLRDARKWVGKTGARADLEKLEAILRPSAMGW